MANARDVYNVDANKAGLADPQNKQFDLSFPYLSQSHVSVTVNGTATTAFTYATSTRIQLNTGPTAGDVVVIKRATSPNTRLVDYQTGSVLSDEILDKDSLQAFYLAQEANDVADIVLSKNASNLFDAGNERITNVANPTAAQDVATKNYLESTWLSASDKTQLNALNTTNLNTVAGAVSNVNTVAGAITNVNTVAGKTTEITALGTSANVSNMGTLAASGVVGNIASVAGISSNVTSVAGVASNVTTVAGISSAVSTVAADGSDIGTVAGISSAVSTVSSNNANVSAVAGAVSNVNTVAGAVSNVNTVAGAVSNVNTTASNITSVNTTATNIANVNTVAGVSSALAGAAGNATAAANSASAAANSAAAAATALDSFDDRYLGAKSSEPSVDNDGNALVSGSLFFDSAVGSMKVYDGGNWILATSAGAVSLLDYEYTATAGQTTFSGSDNNSATLSYSAGNLIVTLNGIVLDNGSDYTATSGTSIVLASGAALNDHLAVVAFKSFTAADTVPASTGGTFAGNVAVTGNISVTGTVDGRDVATDGTKLDGVAAGATAYVHPTGSGNNHVPAAGATGQLLQFASAGTAAWATVSSGVEVTFPSNWSSPTNTYNSSGTWSKGSLSDDDYVWIYLVGGGQGGGNGSVSGAGNRSNGGAGGKALQIYGKAGVLNGGVYVVGAGGAGQLANHHPTGGGATTFTLTASNGATSFNTATQSGRFVTTGGAKETVNLASFDDFVGIANSNGAFSFTQVLPSGVVGDFANNGLNIGESNLSSRPYYTLFSGGGGGGVSSSGTGVGNNSIFAGNGGDGSTNAATAAGVFPGGGGAGSVNGLNQGGFGAAGNVRVYHV